MKPTILVALPGAEAFAEQLVRPGRLELGLLATRRFPDGERYLRLLFDPRGRRVEIVGELSAADEKFLTLAFIVDTLRELGAAHVGLVAPYLAYMRQDARFQAREAVTSRTFSRLLSGAVDRLITVDPHLHRYKSLDDLYTIPTVTLGAASAIGAWIATCMHDPLIIGPDAESEPWARDIAARASAPFVVLAKTRVGDRDVHLKAPDLSAYAGRQPVLIDDIASSGRTLAAAARVLNAKGFGRPVCVVTHAIFGGRAFGRLAPLTDRIVSTDTISHITNAISISPLVAEALVADFG